MKAIKDSVAALSTKIFRNRSGFAGNIGGRISLVVSRLNSSYDKTIRKPEEGFVELEPVSEDVVGDIYETFDDLVEEGNVNQTEISGQLVKQGVGTSGNFIETFPEVKDVVRKYDEKMKQYFGSPYRVVEMSIMRYPELDEGMEALKATRSFHFDEFSTDTVRLFVLLTNVEEDGATSRFLTEDATRDALQRYGRGDTGLIPEQHQDELDEVDTNDFYGKKGSAALAFPVQHLHRGTNPNGSRDILVLTYQASPVEKEPEDSIQTVGYGALHGFSSMFRNLKQAARGLVARS